jgi:hypothetical protein
MKSVVKNFFGRKRSGASELSQVHARLSSSSAPAARYRTTQSASEGYTVGEGSSLVAESAHVVEPHTRCGICFFELPTNAQPIDTTDARGIDHEGNILPPPADTKERIIEAPNSSDEFRSRYFCLDTLQQSAKRGCPSCLKIREVLIRFNHHSIVIPPSGVLYWSTGGLYWSTKDHMGRSLRRQFELFSSNPKPQGRK